MTPDTPTPVAEPALAAQPKPRRKWWQQVLTWLGVCVLAMIVFVVTRPRETVYDGKTVREWFETAVNSNNIDDRLSAINKLVELKAESISYLMERLRLSDSGLLVRYEKVRGGSPGWFRNRAPAPRLSHGEKVMAVYILEEIGPDAASAVPELVRILSSPMATDPMVQLPSRTPNSGILTPQSKTPFGGGAGTTKQPTDSAAGARDGGILVPSKLGLKTAAVYALASIGSDNPQVIAAMLAQTSQRDLSLQLAISQLMVSPRLHPALVRADSMLLSAFKSKDAFTRQTVLRACSLSVSNSAALEGVVLAGANDPDWRLQATAFPLLGAIREDPESAVKALVEALGSPEPMNFSHAIGPPSTFPITRLGPAPRPSEYPNRVVLDLLTRSMPRHTFYYEALLRGLEHTNALVRSGCLLALRQSGPDARVYSAEIEKLFLDESRTVRQIAVSTIWQLTGWRGSMMTFMLSKLSDTNELQRLSGVVFLESNPPKQTEVEARRLLEERVRLDVSAAIRARSAMVLGGMGGDDSKTNEVLTTAAREDEDLTVRKAASEALAKLQGNQAAKAP